MNKFQIRTAENAKKKLKELEEFKKVLEAAIEGKIIMFKDKYCDGNSEFNEIDFSSSVNNYSILKDKVKVYQIIYKVPHLDTIEAFSTADKEHYDTYRSELLRSIHNLVIFKETVEEIEV